MEHIVVAEQMEMTGRKLAEVAGKQLTQQRKKKLTNSQRKLKNNGETASASTDCQTIITVPTQTCIEHPNISAHQRPQASLTFLSFRLQSLPLEEGGGCGGDRDTLVSDFSHNLTNKHTFTEYE